MLVKELQSLGLDIRLYNQSDENEVEIAEDVGDDDVALNITAPVVEDDDLSDNMIIEDEDGTPIDDEDEDFDEDAEFNEDEMLIDEEAFEGEE